MSIYKCTNNRDKYRDNQFEIKKSEVQFLKKEQKYKYQYLKKEKIIDNVWILQSSDINISYLNKEKLKL